MLERWAWNVRRFSQRLQHEAPLLDVIGRVATAGSLGKTDLGALIFWKRIPTGAWAEELLKMPDSEVRDQQLTVPQAARPRPPGPAGPTRSQDRRPFCLRRDPGRRP